MLESYYPSVQESVEFSNVVSFPITKQHEFKLMDKCGGGAKCVNGNFNNLTQSQRQETAFNLGLELTLQSTQLLTTNHKSIWNNYQHANI
jgi:hypothetical protein